MGSADAGLGLCRPGKYSGTYTGSHFPPFSVVSLNTSSTVILQMQPVINGKAKITGSLSEYLTATFQATLDCDPSAASAGSATLLDATYNYSPAPKVPIDGDIAFRIDGPGIIIGDLTEYEVPGGVKNGAKGTGTLSVTRY
jgi:hypothetical protein